MITQVSVLRISAGGLSSVTFRVYPKKMAEWAKNWKYDRTSYPFLGFEEIRMGELSKLLRVAIGKLDKESVLIVGVPGPVYGNEILFCPTLPFLLGDFLSREIEKCWSEKFLIFNNTNLWAEAELRQGAMKGSEGNGILVSLGSGIGAAVVINNSVLFGDSGLAGEIGHTSLDLFEGPQCECGQKGCLELYASGRALMALAQQRGIDVKEPSQLLDEKKAFDFVLDAKRYLVGVIASTTTLLNISKILLGGQLVSLFNPVEIQHMLIEEMPTFLKGSVRVGVARYSAQEGTILGGGIIGLGFQGTAFPELRSIE